MERNSMRSAMMPDASARPDNAFTRFLDAAGTGIGDAYRSFMETPDRMRQQIYDYQISQGVNPEMAALRADRIAGRAGMTTGAVDLLVPQTASDVALSAAGPLGRVAPRAGRAALAAGGAMIGAEPSEAQAMFGGESARGAQNMFRRARDFLTRRYNPEIIHHNTGVFRAPEGRLMFEIDDSAARLNPNEFDRYGSNLSAPMFSKRSMRGGSGNVDLDTKVGDILSHPELYTHYPQLAQIPVRPIDASFNMPAAYNPRTNEIYLAEQKATEMIPSLLHELQHGVQNVEKFAGGGHPERFLPWNHSQTRFQNDQTLQYLQNAYKTDGIDFDLATLRHAIESERAGEKLFSSERAVLNTAKNHPLWEDLKSALTNDAQLTAAEAEAFRKYQALPGERMARTVEERRNMTAAERRAGGIPRIVD